MTFAPWELAYLGAAAFGTALLHSLGGFAGALMLAAAIAPVTGVKVTVPVVATAMIVSHASRAWLFRRAVDWPAFRTVFAVAFPFILLGILFYIELSEAAVGIFLGLFLLASIVLRRVLARRDLGFGRRGLAAVAAPYGFLAGTSFGVGMILGPFLLGAGIVGENLVATAAVLGFGLNVTKSVAFGLSPLLDWELAVIGVVLGLCTVPGHATGRWILRNTPIRVHTYLLEASVGGGDGGRRRAFSVARHRRAGHRRGGGITSARSGGEAMARKTIINPDTLAEAAGPFSRAVRVGDILYVAGTTALSHVPGDYYERAVPDTIEEQTRLTLDNIRNTVEAAGGTMADVFKVVIMLKNPAHYRRMNAVRAEYFRDEQPISTCYQASLMREDILVEIEAMAVLG